MLLADDHAMVRSGFRLILEHEDDIEVVGEAATGVDAVRMARELRPDIVLMDIHMPQLDGLEATRQLAGPQVADPIPVVVVTTFDLDEYLYSALQGGASGFLLKDSGPRLLVEAVRAAAAGDALVSPSVTIRLLRELATATATATAARTPAQPLSRRELDVIRAVAKGHTNTEIGGQLLISLSTVKASLASAQHKLDARNRVEIAAWAWESGLMSR